MKKVVLKVLSVLLLVAFLVSPVAAAAPERQAPVTDVPVLDKLEQSWLDRAQTATSFTVQLVEPSLAVYGGGNAIMQNSSGKLDVDSPAAVAYLQKINDGLDSFISQAASMLGRDLEVLYRYDVVLNGFSAKMSLEEAAMLRELPEVKEVYVDEIYQLDTDVSPEFIGAEQIWDGSAVVNSTGAKGEGTIAGIIDTGINMEHLSFKPTSPQDEGWTAVNPYGTGIYKGLCASNPTTHVCNSKLVGVYDMINGTNGHDTQDHGSHTAGTTAGNTVQVNYGDAVVTISGMAPRANVISYLVCTPDGCYGNATNAAINQAISDGVDSLNYSIGPRSGPARNPWTDSTEMAFLEAFKVGVSVATSAGNSGPNAETIWKLAPWTLVTGNSTHGRIFGYPVTINPGANEQNSIAILAGENAAGPLGADLVGVDLIWGGNVDNNKLGCNSWPADSLAGKVGIVQRGECNFSLKLTNMQNAGAVFGLVYNNAPGAPIVMGESDPLPNPIPAAMISLEAGLAMEAVAASPMTVNIDETIGSGTQPDWGDIMNDSSSRGPITNFDMLEPDLSAPGTNILAPYSGSYAGHAAQDLMSGTSMASPHVAGSTLLMRSVFPTWTPAAIRSALIMTADSDMQNHDLAYANPFQMGNGRVDMSKAALTGLVMEETYARYVAANPASGGDIRALNIPSYQNSNCLGGCSFTRTVKSVSDQAATYTIGVEKSTGVEISVSPATFTIPAGGTQVINVTVNPTITSGGAWQFGRIKFTTDSKFVNSKDISDTAMSLAVKADVSGSTLPGVLTETIGQPDGSYTFENQMNATNITNMSNALFGLTPATIENLEVPQDTTPEAPYDNLNEVGVIRTTCPKNNQRLVVQVLETPSLDIDIFMGTGSNPHANLQKAYSAEAGSMEYINEINPSWPTGTACWILVQNWEASEEGAIDPVKIAYAFVPKTAAGNFTVTTPTGPIAKLTPFDVTVNWDLEASFEESEVWYGYLTLGSTTSIKDDVAKMDINLFKGDVEPRLIANSDEYEGDSNTALTISAVQGILANDINPTEDPLTITLVENVSSGVLNLSQDGSFVYTPSLNFYGTESFSYKISTSTLESNVATVELIINPQLGAIEDVYELDSNTTLTVSAALGVLANDINPSNLPVNVVLVSDVDSGELTLNPDGSFVYIPELNSHGLDVFSYKLVSGIYESNTVLVFLAVEPKLLAYPDEYELDSNTSLSISAAQGVLANDFNPNNEAVTAVLVSGVASGELTLNPDGSFIYTPDENFHGVDQFTYRMSDGLNVSNIVSVSLEVGPGLLANPDEYELDSNTTLSVSAAEGVLTNDLNPSGLPVYAVLVSDVNSGELTLNPDGSFIYAPDNNFHGEDQFTYKMSAGGNVSNTVSVSLDVEPKLIANPDEYSGDSNQSLTVSASEGVLANDLNPTDDDLTITVVDEVSSGVLELSQDGSFVYTPNQNFYGTDTFTYKISTSNLESNVAIVEIKIIPQLEAVEDEYSLNMNSSLTVTVADGVLANDLNPSGLPVDAVLTFNAAFGTLTLNPNGSFTYVPMQNFSGTDYFSYQLKSGTYESNIARVEIHVLPLLNIYLPLVRR